jgi:hypothetical protein
MTDAEYTELKQVIANSVRVVVAQHEDGSQVVRGLDDTTTTKIADAVLLWVLERRPALRVVK